MLAFFRDEKLRGVKVKMENKLKYDDYFHKFATYIESKGYLETPESRPPLSEPPSPLVEPLEPITNSPPSSHTPIFLFATTPNGLLDTSDREVDSITQYRVPSSPEQPQQHDYLIGFDSMDVVDLSMEFANLLVDMVDMEDTPRSPFPSVVTTPSVSHIGTTLTKTPTK